jgi:hypothetical protein
LEVTGVEALHTEEGGVLHLRVSWNISGKVGHWGHIHRRTNSYEADLIIVPVEDAWKIRDFDALSQDRLS